MALFTLTDIKFRKDKERRGTTALTSSSNFQSNILKYPIDLGSVDKGHYMMFSINVNDLTNDFRYCTGQEPSSFKPSPSRSLKFSDVSRAVRDQFSSNEIVNNVLSGIGKGIEKLPDSIQSAIRNTGEFTAGLSEPFAKTDFARLTEQNFARSTTRIADTIAMYMPNTLAFNQSQKYDQVSRNDLLTGSVAAGTVALDSLSDPRALGRNLSPFVAQAARSFFDNLTGSPGTIQTIFAQTFGAVNPRLEVLYSSPQFRNFQFDFMFYPRSEAEALEVQRIIQKFKFHQSPEIKKGTANQFLVPPSDFNIEFYYNGKVNNNIPKIKGPCILDSINVDYAPDGFRAYESYDEASDMLSPSLGKTGMPVGIRMQLVFTEIEFMTKDAYLDDDV
jgi:hypothetical protein